MADLKQRVKKLERVIGHVAYALEVDGRTADGMTKAEAAATLRAAIASGEALDAKWGLPLVAQASKLTASWSGNSDDKIRRSRPAIHAVPTGSHPTNATSICGQVGLAVHENDGAPSPFDPDDAYACKRCAKKVTAEAKATEAPHG